VRTLGAPLREAGPGLQDERVDPARLDGAIRHRVYSDLARSGRAPSAASLAAVLGVEPGTVREGLERLHAAHALVLDQVTREVRMALPFSNVPTPYRLESHGQSWNANCAWDAIALARLLDLRRAVLVDTGGAGRPGRVISLPRPAWRWWDDIVFT
jgi:Alkylmercury lyase